MQAKLAGWTTLLTARLARQQFCWHDQLLCRTCCFLPSSGQTHSLYLPMEEWFNTKMVTVCPWIVIHISSNQAWQTATLFDMTNDVTNCQTYWKGYIIISIDITAEKFNRIREKNHAKWLSREMYCITEWSQTGGWYQMMHKVNT